MRTILHVITTGDQVSGAERVLLDLARAWRSSEDHVEFLSILPGGDLVGQLRGLGFEARSLDAGGRRSHVAAAFALRRELRRTRPEVVHAHLRRAAFLCAAWRTDAWRLVQTRHYADYLVQYGNAVDRAADAWAARQCDHIVAVSEEAREQLVRREGVPAPRVSVVQNGVDIERIATADGRRGREILDATGVGRGPVLVCAAALHPRKNHATLLRAISMLRRTHPDAQLVLLGDGPLRAALAGQTVREGLHGSVHLLGFHDAPLDVIAAGDLYVQPSLEEGFGLAVVEAMALGRPIVASDVGGMRYTVTPDVGVRLDPLNAELWARELGNLIEDAPRRAQMGAAAARRARERYGLEAMRRGYAEVYARVAGSGGR